MNASDMVIPTTSTWRIPSGVEVVFDYAYLEVGGIHIEAGGKLTLDPTRSVKIASRGNIVVEGVLESIPDSPDIIHEIEFINVDESGFVGGGMEVLDSDVGLWVTGAGYLRLIGAEKTSWASLAETAWANSTAIEVSRVSGWRKEDSLSLTPTAAPNYLSWFASYDQIKVAEITEYFVPEDGVSRSVIQLKNELRHDHRVSTERDGTEIQGEVLNLTRNVQIKGTPAGRAHVWIMSTTPQTIENVAISWVGPRNNGRHVVGRYGLHFHHCMDSQTGVTIKGVVITDAGNHAFVTHATNRIKIQGCIAHWVEEDAFWWDPDVPSDGVVWEQCVASSVINGDDRNRLAGFSLGFGEGNRITGCVAVGVRGTGGASGFKWPEQMPGQAQIGVWTFKHNVAHNNAVCGAFAWQNTPEIHYVESSVFYHNSIGIAHGAYVTSYHYEDLLIVRNRVSGVDLFSVSGIYRLSLESSTIDQGGLTEYCVRCLEHSLPAVMQIQTRIAHCDFYGATKAAIGIPRYAKNPDLIEVNKCVFHGVNALWIDSTASTKTEITIDGVVARHRSLPGKIKPEWNASIKV